MAKSERDAEQSLNISLERHCFLFSLLKIISRGSGVGSLGNGLEAIYSTRLIHSLL